MRAGGLGDDVRLERDHLLATLRQVGPGAPTLAGRWSAEELASHLAAQDRLHAVPALVARTAVAVTNARLTAVYLERPHVSAVINGRVRPWHVSLTVLSHPPPKPVLARWVAPVTLWEYFAHHEDVRRPNSVPREWHPRLEPVLDWLLRYNGRRLNRRLRMTFDGRTIEAGDGPLIEVAGELPEIVLWLSGRPAVELAVDATPKEVEALRTRLAV